MKKINLFILIISISFFRGQVGINTNTPDPSAAVEMTYKTGKPGGFLPPRINLQSQTDGITISNPAQSLIVYNTNGSANGLREGLAINIGTPASPVWESLVFDDGVKIGKKVYFGSTIDSSQILQIGGFEFRYNYMTGSGYNFLEARLVKVPLLAVTIYGNRLGWVGSAPGMTLVSQTWGSFDWSDWKQIDFMADGASHFFYLKVSVSDKFYKISSFVTRNNFNSLIVEIY
jgi:hypothetical protein